jgi:hypothetical protein
MEHAKPGYVAPVYPVHPLSMHQPHLLPKQIPPMPMPMPMPMPVAEKPTHTDIHLHSSYQQTTFLVPPYKPMHKPVLLHSYASPGAILVLFILLVIITRCFPRY